MSFCKMSSRNNTECAICGCENKNEAKSKQKLFFYRFPKVREVLKKWLDAIDRNDLSQLVESHGADYLHKKRYMVCSMHFESRCFKHKKSVSGLLKTAVPTKNLFPRSEVMSTNVEISEVKVKVEEQTCYGCLSVDRRVASLGDLQQVYCNLVGTAFTNDSIVFCWECMAILRKIYRFQNQLQNAQNMFIHIQNLSALTISYKDFYDQEIEYNETDCDVKEEISKTESFDNDKYEDADNNEHIERNDKKKINNWKNIKKEYKSYAKHICKEWKKPYTQYFTKVELDEAEIEENFLKKDRKRQGHKMNFKCNNCSLIYGRKIDFDRHNNLNHHKPNTPFTCVHCKATASSLQDLTAHWRSHSLFYKCNACSSHVFPCSLALHLSRSHVNVYACTSCKLTFSSLVSFSEHYNKNHPFVCDYCGKRCALRTVLEKHIKNHHTPQHCTECDRRFDNRKLYRAHCVSAHPLSEPRGAEPALCYCVECDAQFPSRAHYTRHLSAKHTSRPKPVKRKPCPECGKAFAKNSDMLLHYNFTHVKITKYHCDLCDKYFLKRYGLRTHMESVHLKLPKPKNKICDLCGRAFQSKSVLENHRRTHTGERPFRCASCPAAFAQKGAMALHQKKQHNT